MSKLVYCNLDTGEKAGVKFFELGKNMAKYRQIEYRASDGGKVPGFLVMPTEFEKDKKYLVIVNIHNGPYAMHCATFHHEVQLMCANGYAVLLPNPRGSFGYGQEHLDKVVGKYGEGDYTDIMEFVDGALKEFDFLDENRMFVAGGEKIKDKVAGIQRRTDDPAKDLRRFLRRVAGFLSPVRRDNRMPPGIRRKFSKFALFFADETRRHVWNTVDRVAIKRISFRVLSVIQDIIVLRRPSFLRSSAEIVRPDNLVQERIPSEYLVDQDLIVMHLTIIDIEIKRKIGRAHV